MPVAERAGRSSGKEQDRVLVQDGEVDRVLQPLRFVALSKIVAVMVGEPMSSSLRLRNYLSETHEGELNTVYFASATCSLKDVLVSYIGESDAVVGCVGWLTNLEVVDALSALRDGSSFIVDKGYVATNDWLKDRYAKLQTRVTLTEHPWEQTALQVLRPVVDSLEPIRIVGFHGSSSRAEPLMHHKFAVLLKRVDGELVPNGVLLGSFNYTDNADRSIEFLNLCRDPAVVNAFLAEFAALYVLMSEPLGSTTRIPNPEWKSYVDGFSETVRWYCDWTASLALPDDLDSLTEILDGLSRQAISASASSDTLCGDAVSNSTWSASLIDGREASEVGDLPESLDGELDEQWVVVVDGEVIVAWDDELQPVTDDLGIGGIVAVGETPADAVRKFIFELWLYELLQDLGA